MRRQPSPVRGGPWRRPWPLVLALATGAIGYVWGVSRAPTASAPTVEPPSSVAVPTSPTSPGTRVPPPRGREVDAPPALAPAPAESTPPSFDRVTGQAALELERIKPVLVARCWASLPADSRPERVTYVLNLSFDSEGREVARGIEEERGSPPELGRCLREVFDTAMRIPAPGSPASTTLAVSFP